MNSHLYVDKAAVLGAGVMGAQIAAHLANADIPTLLFDLPADGEAPGAIAAKAVAQLAKLEPAPLAGADRVALIHPADYAHDLEQLAGCGLIIEAISERPDWKAELYAKVAPHIGPDAVFASNTSGLSIEKLAGALPEDIRPRFCGVHFFNPPRYMHLVELIAHPGTEPRLLDRLETFLVSTLGKGVVRAKDTPNFIANRVGVFSMIATLHHAERLGLGFDLVDALTGTAIGRPKSATYRTADVVGLDTLKHVVEGSARVLADDPWVGYFRLPEWMNRLIEDGAVGQKSRRGVYRKQGKDILVLDPDSGDYRPADARPDPELERLLKIRDPGERLAALRDSASPEARFLWAIQRDVFHYAAVHLDEIADTARDLDLAIRWGFGWRQGPFETWQQAGWSRVADWIRADIDTGKSLSDAPLPDWVDRIEAAHGEAGSYSASEGRYKPRRELPVYRRQLFPETVAGEPRPDAGRNVFETEAVRLWHLDDEPEIGVLSFKSKMHAVGEDVLDGILQSLDAAERAYRGLVIWQPQEPFSAGADLSQVLPVLKAGELERFEKVVAKFQQTSLALRASRLPVVAAVRGLALGGGCEFLMHCDRTVAALESYIGLVEVGVGLLPAGGGCKELLTRAVDQARGGDPFPFIRRYFETVAMGTVSKSAVQARELGFLRPADLVILHPHELLYVARAQAKAMACAGYRPPRQHPIAVPGRDAVATLESGLANMRAGGMISAHDYRIGRAIAVALCGGEIDRGSEVGQDWLLALERNPFVELAGTEKTQQRIEHMLNTGKPLRN